jgi:hypothetical protein
MALNLVPSALSIPWVQKAQVLPADGLNAKTVALGGFTNAGTTPSKIFAVVVSNNDTVAHDVQLGIMDATGFYPLGTVTVPINAGYIGTIPSVSLLNSIAAMPLDETGVGYFFIQPTDAVQVRCMIAAVNAGKEIDVVVQGADF